MLFKIQGVKIKDLNKRKTEKKLGKNKEQKILKKKKIESIEDFLEIIIKLEDITKESLREKLIT